MMDANVIALDGVNQDLKEKYKAILSGLFDELSSPDELSKIFLTSVAGGYEDAKRKIMVVGREPGGDKGWHWGKKCRTSKDLEIASGEMSLEALVKSAMQYHSAFYSTVLTNAKREKGSTFQNFLLDVRCRLSPDYCGMIYSNIFCFSTRLGRGANKHKDYESVKKFSKGLLLAQIEILKPDTIIFANGTSGPSVDFRRECFPMDQCTDRHDYVKKAGIPNIQLWGFKFNGIQCYRIQHPSSRHPASSAARKYFLESVLF